MTHADLRPARRYSRAVRGFTLVELLIVVAILGLLAALVAPRYFGQLSKSEVGVARAQIQNFAQALDAYRLDNGAYPSTEQGLRALFAKPADAPKWRGPYLQKEPPADPWGHPYVYRVLNNGADYELKSLGRDRRPGGDGDDADISR